MKSATTKSTRVGDCPREQAIALALDDASLEYRTDFEGCVPEHLDFYLPGINDVFIEVKGGHSDRTAGQMARVDNVIVAQGPKAVELLARLIGSQPRQSKPGWDLQRHVDYIGRLRRDEPTTQAEWDAEYAWLQSQSCLKQPGEQT